MYFKKLKTFGFDRNNKAENRHRNGISSVALWLNGNIDIFNAFGFCI